MICNTLCVKNKPKEYNKLFFGDYGNFQRIDKEPFPIFKKLAEASEANTWFMNEIDYTKDKKGIELLPEHAFRMFQLTINYQNIMDSLVPNTFSLLSNIASETWLSYLYSRISTEEEIHSLNYSNGLTQVFGDKATEIMDTIYIDTLLQKRTDKEIESANKFIKIVVQEQKEDDEAKKAIIDLLLRTFYLEGIKFPYSFLITWSINKAYNNCIQGFSQALKLIAFDELTVHVTTGVAIMNLLFKSGQGFEHLKSYFEETAVKMLKETVELELEWNKYIFKEGIIPGLNQNIGEHFIKYWADYRLKQLKLPTIYNEQKSDIIDWFNNYRRLNKTQVALQEADNTNYQKGTLKNDLALLDKDL